jgi:hypothetical protein
MFPLTFQSPSARVSLKINQRIRWNAGYQYYGYRQEFNLIPLALREPQGRTYFWKE